MFLGPKAKERGGFGEIREEGAVGTTMPVTFNDFNQKLNNKLLPKEEGGRGGQREAEQQNETMEEHNEQEEDRQKLGSRMKRWKNTTSRRRTDRSWGAE